MKQTVCRPKQTVLQYYFSFKIIHKEQKRKLLPGSLKDCLKPEDNLNEESESRRLNNVDLNNGYVD